MKTIKVVSAVICASLQEKTRIFATARGYGEFKGLWEFPGGKIEPGETPQQALIREIQEELETKIKVGELIETIEYDYLDFHLSSVPPVRILFPIILTICSFSYYRTVPKFFPRINT